MSTAAIQKVLKELEGLPESDQDLVLGFLRALKSKRSEIRTPSKRRGRNPALKIKDGRLVFTGKIGNPHVDWLRVVREEREDEIIRQAYGDAKR